MSSKENQTVSGKPMFADPELTPRLRRLPNNRMLNVFSHILLVESMESEAESILSMTFRFRDQSV